MNKPARINTVFFDFDGVLSMRAGGCDDIVEAIATKHRVPAAIFKSVFIHYNEQTLKQDIRFASFIGQINGYMGSRITVDDLHAAVVTASPNAGMLAAAKDLRANGIRTGIITDNGVERMELLTEKFGLDEFTPVIASGAVGSAKYHGTRIFEYALEAAGVPAEETLFVDNLQHNLIPAEQVGMQTYWHDHDRNDVGAFAQHLGQLGQA